MLRRTKIIATLGPASSEPHIVHELLAAGVDVVRINFSHADASAVALIKLVRTIAQELERPLTVIADLQGPKIRIGCLKNKAATLVSGQQFTLDCYNQNLLGNQSEVFVAYPNLIHEIALDDVLLINDGLVELKVLAIEKTRIRCLVIEGGLISDRKGLNKRGGGLSARALTAKDKRDLKTALSAQVDYICLSFVKDGQDIKQVRTLIKEFTDNHTAIIAKIERSEALAHLNEIIYEADAIMVARGDLGVEIEAAEIPAIQKHIIEQTRLHDKVVITATQMMESMINNPQPTRAEVSDVANAVLDGTDAVMLSAETASGHFPIKVIHMVNKTCLSAEKHALFSYRTTTAEACHYQHADQAIALAAAHVATHFPIQAIIALTESGDTALWISRQHNNVPIFAVSANERTIGRLNLVNNVFPICIDFHSFDPLQLNNIVLETLIARGYLRRNGYILLTRGKLIGTPGGTNSLEIIALSPSSTPSSILS